MRSEATGGSPTSSRGSSRGPGGPAGRWALALLAGVAGFLAAGASPAAAQADAAEVMREGAGERRAMLNAKELTGFDQRLWAELDGWQNGEPIDAASAGGKVVLVYTWSSFLRSSARPLSAMQRLHEAHAADGLLVVGVHHAEGWDEGLAAAERRRVTFPIARDADGAFRRALLVDQDPDFYLIDRAGQLRYADVETGSIGNAVTKLLAEDAGRASSTKDRMREAEDRADAEARRLRAIRDSISLSDLPKVPFAAPPGSAYQSASWPRLPRPDRGSRNDDEAPILVELDGRDRFLPTPPDDDGRVTLLYFWAPSFASGIRYFDQMDRIQKANERDLVVVGVLTHGVPGGRRDNAEALRDEEREGSALFGRFLDRLPVNHYLFNDLGVDRADSRVLDTVYLEDVRGSIPAPVYAIISSDGTLRWWGSVLDRVKEAEFEAALRRTIEQDPGVAARRAAEEEFIRRRDDR